MERRSLMRDMYEEKFGQGSFQAHYNAYQEEHGLLPGDFPNMFPGDADAGDNEGIHRSAAQYVPADLEGDERQVALKKVSKAIRYNERIRASGGLVLDHDDLEIIGGNAALDRQYDDVNRKSVQEYSQHFSNRWKRGAAVGLGVLGAGYVASSLVFNKTFNMLDWGKQGHRSP